MKRMLMLWDMFHYCPDDKAEALGIVDTHGADTCVAKEEARGRLKVERIKADKRLTEGLMLISKV